MMKEKYKSKCPLLPDLEYFKKHAEEIIEANELMAPGTVTYIATSHVDWGNLLERKAMERGHYSRMEAYMNKEELKMPPEEAYMHTHCRLNREFAKKTGHWDLFIWE